MAKIDDRHVAWGFVDRLRDLLENLPDAEHEVTLTYSLFSSILCWTCQRGRDTEHDAARKFWSSMSSPALCQPWALEELKFDTLKKGEPLSDLPAGRFLVGIRNAIAHGDDRKVKPLHQEVRRGRADRRLVGFKLTVSFGVEGQPSRYAQPKWGEFVLRLQQRHMRLIGLDVARRFCAEMDVGGQEEAKRHVLAA